MDSEQFHKVFKEVFGMSEKVLTKKETEYGRGDRYHNFKRAAAKLGITPLEALQGMKVKHEVSVDDLIADLKAGKTVPMSVVKEKVGDMINYDILAYGLFSEHPLVLPEELPEGTRKLTEILGVGPLSPEEAKRKLQQKHRYKRGKNGHFTGSVKKKK